MSDTRLRVLHVGFSDHQGGAAIACWRMHQCLQRLARSELLTPAPPHGRLALSCRGERYGIGHWLMASGERGLSALLYPDAEHKVSLNLAGAITARRINAAQVDLVHLHWIHNATLSLRQLLRIDKPLVISLHDEWWYLDGRHCRNLKGKQPGASARLATILRRPLLELIARQRRAILKRALFTAPSAWLCRQAIEHLPEFASRIRVVPNPIDTKLFCRHARESARRHFGLPLDRPLLLFGAQPGWGGWLKGRDLAFAAARQHLQMEGGQRFLMVTFGGYRPGPYCEAGVQAVELGFLAEPQELARLYAAADLTLVTSRLEAFGQVAAESLACGTPVIAFRDTGVESSVIDGCTGGLADPHSPDSVAERMAWLLSRSDAEREQQALACREHALKHFSESVVAGALMGLYREAIARHARANEAQRPAAIAARLEDAHD